MTQVLIQPVFGDPQARHNWSSTVEQEVDFAEPSLRSTLAPAELAALQDEHPSGRAQFWGNRMNQDKKADRVRTGDIVLFTGNSRVRAFGEVACHFRNARFADRLWDPDEKLGSWLNVYSISSLEPCDIPYDVLRELEHFSPNYPFRAFNFLPAPAAEDVLIELQIKSRSAVVREREDEERRIAESMSTLTEPDGDGRLVELESARTVDGEYDRPADTVRFRRIESQLVQAYVKTLPGFRVKRYMTVARRVTDLHLVRPDGAVEIVEAKGRADHHHVRQALGQLLDYAPDVRPTPDFLSALFPVCPADADGALLHRYGIDVIYHLGAGNFAREPAPNASREAMRSVWTGSV